MVRYINSTLTAFALAGTVSLFAQEPAPAPAQQPEQPQVPKETVTGCVMEAKTTDGGTAYVLNKAEGGSATMYVLAGMLFGGLICNLLIRPVKERHFMTAEKLAAERSTAREQAAEATAPTPAAAGSPALLFVAWTAIAIPLAWGVWITVTKSLALFR